MWKILGTLALMVGGGVITLAAAMVILMVEGTQRYDNYEYYGNYPVLYLGPAAIGFFVPGVVAWYLDKRAKRKGRSR